MLILKQGSKGNEVVRLQQMLKKLGLFKFGCDGDFGPRTLQAVQSYQTQNGLVADGIVGPKTLARLKADTELYGPPEPPHDTADMERAGQPLFIRCLSFIARTETGRDLPGCFAQVTGNFDKMAVSYGVLQWNFGMKSLQPILLQLFIDHPQVMSGSFGADAQKLHALLRGPHDQLMTFFKDVQKDAAAWSRWQGYFASLGATDECIRSQKRAAAVCYKRALKMCQEYGLETERAVALMFDIVTQNGSIRPETKALILSDCESASTEAEKLEFVAKRRSEAALPEWQHDVYARKHSIAQGGGAIHGKHFDLERDYGIGLRPAEDLVTGFREVA